MSAPSITGTASGPNRLMTDADMAVILADYLRALYPTCTRIALVSNTLHEMARRIAADQRRHDATRRELDALVIEAGGEACVAEATAAILRDLPSWLTVRHA